MQYKQTTVSLFLFQEHQDWITRFALRIPQIVNELYEYYSLGYRTC